YQAGPLSGALPTIAIFDPLTAVLFGVGIFGEHMAVNPVSLLGQGLGFALMAAAIIRLAGLAAGRHPAQPRCALTARAERELAAAASCAPRGGPPGSPV